MTINTYQQTLQDPSLKRSDKKEGILKRLWDFLTAPPPDMSDSLSRQRARILSSVGLVYFIAILFFYVALTANNGFEIANTIGTISYGLAYILSRTRLRRIGAYLLIGGICANILLIVGDAKTPEMLFASFFGVAAALVLLVAFGTLILNAFEVVVANVLALGILAYIIPRALQAGEIVTFSNSHANLWVNLVISTVLFVILTIVSFLRQHDLAVIQRQNESLAAHAADLEKRVMERTEELRIAKEEAETSRDMALEANRVKSQFLASMSHELRTPLNAILNFTDMMIMGLVGPINPRQEDVLTKSLDSGKHLLSLINDVLDISKMVSGALALFLEEGIDLHTELQPVIDTARTLLKDKPVQLVTDIDADLPLIGGDRRRIRQILLNLISNAAKFTEKGSVTLSAKARGDEVLFAVTDTGPGIEAKDQEIIFEPFQQTETGIQHAGGTGLGLPISKHLVEAHGGRIWLESAPGDGAAFYVVLPVKPTVCDEGGSDVQ